MTFASRILSASSKALRLTVSIDGVPLDLTAAFLATAPTAPALDGRGMLVSAEESTTTLDRQKRIQVGGGFVAVIQDRNSILRNLFATRNYRATWLTAPATKSATTLSVNSTTPLPSSGVVYIAGETIQYTGKTIGPDTLTGCTRGAYGSPAQSHRGGVDQGASVFLVPPSFLGRRVRLVGSFDDDDGNPDTSTTETLGTYRLERAPVEDGQGRWELRCSHLSDEFAKRKIGSGIKEIKTPGSRAEFSIDAGTQIITIVTLDGVAKLLTQGAYPTHLMVQSAGAGRTILPIRTITDGATGDIIECYAIALTEQGRRLLSDAWWVADSGGNTAAKERLEIEWVKHVCLLEGGTPANLLKYALTSIVGDGANGSNDVLGGRVPSTLGGPGFRLGAGMPGTEIDTASLTTGSIPTAWTWVIDEELPVADIVRDYCRDSNTAAVFSPAGLLTFKPLVEQRATAVASITEDDVIGVITAHIAEENIYGRARLDCGYDPIDNEYEASIDVIDEEIAATYAPAEGSLVLESRSVMIDPIPTGGEGSLVRPTTSIDEILPDLRRSMLDNRGGSLHLTFLLDARHMQRSLGDLLSLSFPSVSDFRGGNCGAVLGRVMERTPNWTDLTMEVSVIVEEAAYHFSPFGVATTVDAPAAGVQVLHLSTTDFGHGSTPAASFRVGDALNVYNPTTNVMRANNIKVTATNNVGDITVEDLSGAVLPVVAGEVVQYVYATLDGTSNDGFAPDDLVGLDGDNGFTLGLTRWR